MAADDTSPKPTETVGDGPPPEPCAAVEGNLPPGLIEALESLGDTPHDQLMEVMAIFDQTIDEVIPAKALVSFPFKAEPLTNWNMAGDLGQFMYGLYSARVIAAAVAALGYSAIMTT
jgi:hypothetical protein